MCLMSLMVGMKYFVATFSFFYSVASGGIKQKINLWLIVC
jgi:hypothetical protein